MRSYLPLLSWLLLSALVGRAPQAQPLAETKLSAFEPHEEQDFGAAVALDGDVAVVGAFRDGDAGLEYGAAYVYRFDGSTWNEEAKLTAPEANITDWYGWSVAVSGDVLLVGARDEELGINAGGAYAYRYDGGAWVLEGKLLPSDGAARDDFSRALDVEGDVAIIGSAMHDLNQFNSEGAAYIFRYDGTQWVEEQKLTASDPMISAFFGWSVALSGDRAIVGSWGTDLNVGAAYVFEYDGSQWVEAQKLSPEVPISNAQFGVSVALDGDLALSGADLDDEQDNGNGAAYVFRFDGNAWAQEQKLFASDTTGFNLFGTAVALDGERALVGSDNWFPDGGDAFGRAYLFSYDADLDEWVEEAAFVASDASGGDSFGAAVAMDGGVLLIGAPEHDLPVPTTGAAYVYGEPAATSEEEAAPSPPALFSSPSPNPFRSETRLTLTLAEAQPLRVAVYDVLGRRVAVLYEGRPAAGTPVHLTWDAKDVAPGLYVVRAVTPTVAESRRVVLQR